MKMRALFTLFLLCISPAAAQQPQPKQDDPAFMQRALTALQAQRNQALDYAAVEAARVAALTEELGKAQTRIKELEKSTPKK